MDFLEHCRDKYEEGKIISRQAHEARIVKRIMAAFDVTVEYGEMHSVEFGTSWMHQQYPTFPVILGVDTTKVDVAQLFRAVTKTPIWLLLMDFLESIDGKTGGLIVPAYSDGQFVAHNWWAEPEVPGFTRLIRRGRREESGLVFEPLEAFLTGVKLSGWNP